jgi:hypothetical protein
VPPPVASEKLNWPGILSKNAEAAAPTVRVTGTVIALVALKNLTCPVYVPAARVTAGFTLTVTERGVVQQKPLGETESQLPPVAVNAVAVKANAEPVLLISSVCGSGLAPPNGLVKLRPFCCVKTLSPTVTLTGTVTRLPFVSNKS